MKLLDRALAALLAVVLVAGLGCAASKQRENKRLQRAESHYNLGVDYLANGNTAMAIRELQASLEVEEEAPRPHHAIAEAYRAIGRFALAHRHLERALEIDPDFQGARLSLSALLVQMEDYAAALRQSEILAQDPTFPAPWRAVTNQGWAQFKLGQVEEARESFRLALEMHRDYWPALLNLGILEAEAGQREAALGRFERVLAAKPGPMAAAEANYRMAELYVALGERDRALSHLSAVTESSEFGPWAEASEEYRKLLQ